MDTWDSVVSYTKTGWSYFVEFTANDATALAFGNGLNGDEQGIDRNALAHAHTSALLAYSAGEDVTNILGLLKEVATNDPSKANDTYKDLFNNEIGIQIGRYVYSHGFTGADAQEAIDDLIMDAYRNGDLIVNPRTDPRVFTVAPVWGGPSSDWQNASAGRDYSGTVSGEAILMGLASLPFAKDVPGWIGDAMDWIDGLGKYLPSNHTLLMVSRASG